MLLEYSSNYSTEFLVQLGAFNYCLISHYD